MNRINILDFDAPELAVYHWYPHPDKEKRYIEIWLPIANFQP